MKKLLCVLVSLFILLSSSVVTVYAESNHNDSMKNKDAKANYLKSQLKKYYTYGEKRKDLIKQIIELKKKYGDNSITVFVDGEEVECDDLHVIKGGRMLIPISPIAKALGAEVKWDRKTGDVTIIKDGITIVLRLGSNVITVNGVKVKLDDYVQSNGKRTMVPISFISKILKHKIIIDGSGVIDIEKDNLVTVNDSATGAGNNQFEYVGSWNYGAEANAYMKDNHWSLSPDAFFQVRFNGTQIKLYGAKAPTHGIAAVSIDGGAETFVDYYAATRTDDTLLYTSQALADGQHTLRVRVTGAKNSSSSNYFITTDRVDVTENSLISNLALGKPVVSSSIYSVDMSADKAVDGIVGTRWSSLSSDPQWIYVDLGSKKNISRVKLNWEAAYGKEYKIQVSNNVCNVNSWKDVYSTVAGDGGIDDITFAAVDARYVRMYGIKRGSQLGYSLWEFEVYSKGGTPSIPSIGMLAGSASVAPAGVNLSTEGTLDWVHWGLTDASGFNRKSGTIQQISNYTKIGNGNIAWLSTNPVLYSWTGGSPITSTVNTISSVYLTGVGNGFQITVPADTTQKTLKVYVGAWAAKGKFEAALSDGSASPFVKYVDSSSGITCKVFTLSFKALTSGQTLTVKYISDIIYTPNFGNISLQAATLY